MIIITTIYTTIYTIIYTTITTIVYKKKKEESKEERRNLRLSRAWLLGLNLRYLFSFFLIISVSMRCDKKHPQCSGGQLQDDR